MAEQRDRSDAQQAMLATLCVIIGFGLWVFPVAGLPELGWFTNARFPASVMMMLLSFYFLLLRRR